MPMPGPSSATPRFFAAASAATPCVALLRHAPVSAAASAATPSVARHAHAGTLLRHAPVFAEASAATPSEANAGTPRPADAGVQPRAMYGLAPTVNPAFEHRNPVASMYEASARERWAPGRHWVSSRNADYGKASRAGSAAGIDSRRSDLGSMFMSSGWDVGAPVAGTRWGQAFMAGSR
jgi:hypothetical protein